MIHIIIVTWNSLKWIDRCLGSLRRQTLEGEVVVIDNCSSDLTVEHIRTNFPEVTILPQSSNLGFAAANNLGMRWALDRGTEGVLLLNQDAWLVQDDALEQLVAVSAVHPEYAVLSPMQLYGNGQRVVYEAKNYGARAAAGEDWISDAYFNRLRDVYEVKYVCAASWFLPVATLRSMGGFDPLFYHNGEDDNFLQRVHYHGLKAGLCPNVNVCHDIEERPADYNAATLDWRKYLLIQYCDVNVSLDMDDVLRRLRRKITVQALRFQRKHLRESIPEYRYLKSQKSAIEHSREVNKTVGEHWL